MDKSYYEAAGLDWKWWTARAFCKQTLMFKDKKLEKCIGVAVKVMDFICPECSEEKFDELLKDERLRSDFIGEVYGQTNDLIFGREPKWRYFEKK